MKKYYLQNLSLSQRKNLIRRNLINNPELEISVRKIVTDVKRNGIKAALKYSKNFDGFTSKNFLVTEREFETAVQNLSPKIKSAVDSAYQNILSFHKKQLPGNYTLETVHGVKCSRKFLPIQNVGLYIPSGTAPLPSTMLMLGIPAQIAGCKRIVATSPAKDSIHPAILYAAKICGVTQFIKIGGAQGISILAYGDRVLERVDKIFGPGNQYVTIAKGLVSIDPEGCTIDMPAGPSELLVIADENADTDFIAADLISQAEHGSDCLVVLVSTSNLIIEETRMKLAEQTKKLAREKIVREALKNSFSLLVDSLADAFEFSNEFAPEHLIVNLKNPEKYINRIINAGSVFLGKYSPESAGDYASGTNHTLPTYGFARASGGVSVEMFMKSITFQNISKRGLKNLAKSIVSLAEAESLYGHAEAVRKRIT